MPYEFASESEKLSSFMLIIVGGVSIFFLFRFIDIMDHYSHFIYLDKPLICKKCNKKLTTFRTCSHAKHSRLMPFFVAFLVVSIFPFSIYVLIPWSDSIEPTTPDPKHATEPREPITYFTLIRDHVLPLLR